MGNEKNINSRDKKSSKGEEKNYDFIRETIKNRPLDKKRLLYRIGALAGAGIIIGVTAALAFSVAAPRLVRKLDEGKQQAKIDIPQDDPSVTPTATPVPVAMPSEESAMEQAERAYQEALQISEEPRKAIVSVVGQKEKEDILDNTLLTSGRAMGIIILEDYRDYYILTQQTAVKKAENIQETFQDGTIVNGAIKKSDSRTDLAVVTVHKRDVDKKTQEGVSVAVLGNSYSLIQGKTVIAIGSPSGYDDSVYFGTITSVSNKVAVTDTEYNLLITDILGSQQGSGVLLDTDGEVIGLIAQDYGDEKNESKTMVKALAVSQLKPLIETLSNGEAIQYLGVRGKDISENVSNSIDIPQGVYVKSVEDNSPAMEAGLQSGDVIQKIDGKEIETMQQYSSQLQKCEGGQKVSLTVMRSKGAEGYAEMKIEAEVESR